MAESEARKSARVRTMFDGIAGRYDLLNHLLSLNLDRSWRRAAAREVPANPKQLVLDLCGGTGDLSVELAAGGRAGLVTCCDFSRGMLARARPKFARKRLDERCVCVEGDGQRLPFADGAFQAVALAFGVRNFADMGTALGEVHRVLAPGGRMVVLEFSQPAKGPLGGLYRFYLKRLLPRVGDGISGRSGPYRYLARTISEFPDAPTLAARIREAGFAACGWRQLTGGIVAVHTALKSSDGLAVSDGCIGSPA